MASPRADYGIDAPLVPTLMVLGGFALLGLSVFAGPAPAVSAAFLFFGAGSFLYTTRIGKRRAWDRVLDTAGLKGTERVLDVGCGRGLVLLAAARRLPAGRAVGIDLWQTQDQSGNARDTTLRNATAEGVADRIELHTGDMRTLPFPDASFDAVVSSLAVHNVPDADGRARAVQEMLRVLQPGGTLLLADFRSVDEYVKTLQAAGQTVQVRSLGPGFWYGGPWAATRLITVRKTVA